MTVRDAIHNVSDTVRQTAREVGDRVSDLIPWNWGKRRLSRPVDRRRGEPLEPVFERFRHELDRMDELWRSSGLHPEELLGGRWPRVDVEETPNEIRVVAELPGVDEKDIDVSVGADVLTLRGRKRQQRQEQRRGAHRQELFYGAFQRNIPLSAEVDAERATATFRRGELLVTLPKQAVGSHHRIPIQ